MKATATRDSGYRHVVRVRSHDLSIDEPADTGGTDAGPSPQELLAASLASCTAVTMEMYATRKGWDIGGVEVACEYAPAERGCPTRFGIVVRVPDSLSKRKGARPRRPPTSRSSACASSPPSAPCTARSTARSCSTSVSSGSRSRTELAQALRGALLDPEEASRLDGHGRNHPAVLVPLSLDGTALHAVFPRRRDDLRRHAGEISF